YCPLCDFAKCYQSVTQAISCPIWSNTYPISPFLVIKTPPSSMAFLSIPLKTSTLFLFPKIPLKPYRDPHPLPVVSCTSPKFTERQVLHFVAESDEKTLPCVRTYDNDLARLSLVGAVSFDQALTAAAADGGQSATEHIDSGVPAMVVETLFPDPSNKMGTVSTRLFLPAKEVREKASKLKRSLSVDMLSSTTSRNILAMTFRQVVLQQLWNFELVVMRPGTERNMADLENPRKQVAASFTISSSDERVIAVLAEAVCTYALQSTEKQFLGNLLGGTSTNFFKLLQGRNRIASKDSSVIIESEEEIAENAKSQLEKFNSMKETLMPLKTKPNYFWWTQSIQSKLEKIGGPEFSAWTSEYIPTYRLQIDANKFESVKFEGWKESGENRREVLLTHSQMVGLADILDTYYEDIYSLPNKQLSGDTVSKFSNLPNKKRTSSLLKILSFGVASGVFLIVISALGQFCLPHLPKGGIYLGGNKSLSSSEIECTVHQSLDGAKLEDFCTSIIKRIKDAFGWPGDIMTEVNLGTWIGEIPNYLKIGSEADSGKEDYSTNSDVLENVDSDMKSSVQGIASYQVVLSTDGKIVGFQPTSRIGVNHWAANPLAKELYSGRKLSPGILEPGLKIHLPNEVVVIELLMSVNPDSCFALARSFQ
ncbi:hypothetical protein CFOL_v3_20442, partial [Cephalotus follicularis]